MVLDVYKDRAGEWRWRVVADDPNDSIVADSGEGYVNQEDAVDMAKRLFSADVVTRIVVAGEEVAR